MGLLFASLGALSFRDSYLHLPTLGHSTLTISGRSIFFGTIVVAVILILACLTNPSESSFRTFLTEQSFRRHLHKLNQDSDSDVVFETKRYSLPRHDVHKSPHSRKSNRHAPPGQGVPLRFHFSNRAAISLQTPAHIFRSYGLFTLAVTQLVDTAANATYNRSLIHPEPAHGKIRGTWFIGAFGKWWIGGSMEFFAADFLAHSTSPVQDVKTGFCNVRSLDKTDAYEGLPIKGRAPKVTAVKPRSQHQPRSVKQTATPLPSRSSTPPLTLSKNSTPLLINVSKATTTDPTSYIATSNGHIVEDTADVADILQKITQSQAAVQELRNQLNRAQTQSFASHADLQSSLDEHRTRKRQDDASRLDLKARTKALEESKRQAETAKRDAEKKLKAAQTARDNATSKVKRLTTDIEALRRRMVDGDIRVAKSSEETETFEKEASVEVENKRVESKQIEETVALMSQRARELEDTMTAERQRLEVIREELEVVKQEAMARLMAAQAEFYPAEEVVEPWTTNLPQFNGVDTLAFNASQSFLPPRRSSDENVQVFEPSTGRPPSLSHVRVSSAPLAIESQLNNLDSSVREDFSPFDVDDRVPVHQEIEAFAPLSAALLPANLVNSMETEHVLTSDSPSYFNSSDSVHKPIAFATQSPPTTRRGFDPFDAQRALPLRSLTEAQTNSQPELTKVEQPPVRKWFSKSATSSSDNVKLESTSSTSPNAEKSKLNPDAKVFSLPKGRSLLSSSLWSPTGITMPAPTNVRPTPAYLLPSQDIETPLPSTSPPLPKARFGGLFSSRPFAPSPAEREALQRALNKNVSHDRISVTSDGSGGAESSLRLPPSPFGLPTGSQIFEVEEEDSGWDNVLSSAPANQAAFTNGEGPIVRQTTR